MGAKAAAVAGALVAGIGDFFLLYQAAQVGADGGEGVEGTAVVVYPGLRVADVDGAIRGEFVRGTGYHYRLRAGLQRVPRSQEFAHLVDDDAHRGQPAAVYQEG